MEVNKEQAERCRDMGAGALKQGDFPRAVKFLQKSLQLYPLPGVDALLSSAKSQMASATNNSNESSTANTGSSQHSTSRDFRHASSTSSQNLNGADGRAYTEEQVEIVKEVLRAKEGGRGAHYRVLKLNQGCNESEIKKAYRKLSLKVHPDKNSAPNADEAFKAVGLAYATLSDPQKRTIYDRYGEEDPDNRGAARAGGGMNMHHRGQEVSPEEIFNMFFGGGMPGMNRGGPGFHVYTSGFGPGGMPFRTAAPRRQPRQQEREERQAPFLSVLFQFMPLLLILFSTFFRSDGSSGAAVSGRMPGEGEYFNLVRKTPFVNLMKTQTTKVRDIPFYVTTNFARSYARNQHQLRRVEQMVEVAYEQYLIEECTKQRNYKKRLQINASNLKVESEEKAKKIKQADAFELSRCLELEDLFPHRKVEL